MTAMPMHLINQATGQTPRPAIKPPMANGGVGPQPKVGQQPPFVARTPGWNPNGSNAGGAPAPGAPKVAPPPMQRTPNPMLMNTPAQGAPGGGFASQQGIELARQRQQQSQQPMAQQVQGAVQQQRGAPGPMNPAVTQQIAPPQPYNMPPSTGANTTMARPMYIPHDVAPPPANPQQPQAQPQQQMAAQPMYGNQPQISTGEIYNQQQQNQLINQAIGQNGMQAATNRQAMMSGLGSAGFAGAGSPKGMALENQIRAAQMGADNAARTGIPLQLAEKNAQHLLASQRAAEDQYSNRQNERLTGQGQQLGFMSNLMGSLLV